MKINACPNVSLRTDRRRACELIVHRRRLQYPSPFFTLSSSLTMQSPKDTNNADSAPQQTSDEASNVFAASAAEGVLLDKPAAVPAAQLDDIGDAINRTAESSPNPPKDESVPSAVSQSPSNNTADVLPVPDQLDADDPKSELTKEELIEEALNCPCIANMKDGSCGDPFIAAYRCFLESDTEPRGMDCMDQFREMRDCISEHPEEYNMDDDEDADLLREPSNPETTLSKTEEPSVTGSSPVSDTQPETRTPPSTDPPSSK